MTAPYDNFAEFAMFATLHDGTIYIEEDFASRAASLAEEATRPPPRNPHPDQQSQAMMTYWGYKFETLSLIPTPPPNTTPAQVRAYQSAQTSNHAQHCSIVHTSFGPHTLLLGGEVDGLLGPKPSPAEQHDKPIPWVELKTAEQLPPPHRQQHRDVLRFEPRLTDRLAGLSFAMQFRGTPIRVELGEDDLTVTVQTDGFSRPIRVGVGDETLELGAGDRRSFRLG